MRGNQLKRKKNSILLFIIIISFIIPLLPSSTADLDELVTLSHTSGPPGTIVDFSINIQTYFALKYPPGDETITGDRWENYVGKRYVLLWDMDNGEDWQPQYWDVIGEAWVDSNGVLWGETTIPNAVAGHHSIAAVYENNYVSGSYMSWWKTPFIVTEGSGGSSGISGVTTGNDNSGNDGSTPGFEVVAFFCAVVAVCVLLKKKK
jgi:hypothetical protein